ncbi:hypothetical protein [Rhodococcus pyridinivorans]|jgi:hypothetical protein|uniref:hypothetical protein n=1 Tax=Rhodococcus pyridinivorans TaxID=103816 RepID=UPI003AAC6C87
MPLSSGHTNAVATLTVRVADRRHSPVGLATIRTITIAGTCPRCGGPRGEPYPYNFYDDGAWLVADCWDNPCGHVDLYNAVLAEAERGPRT